MTNVTLRILTTILDVTTVFFAAYLVGYSTFLFLSASVGSSELYRKKKQYRLMNAIRNEYFIPISIVVPAYNEEVTVADTVRSLLAMEYSVYEIIVVDDGSRDRTSQVLIDAFDMETVRMPIRRVLPCEEAESVYAAVRGSVHLTLIRKKNGGKADALNMGINAARYPWFICMDADSALQYDSLRKIALPLLEDENVIAVGGSVRPANGIPYLIRYATDAICWSQAPERLRDLIKQRRRWQLGLFQCMWLHRGMALNYKFGLVSLVSYTYFLLYELFAPFIELFGLLTMTASALMGMLNIPFALTFLLIYTLFSSVMSLTSFFARIQTLDLDLRFADAAKAVLLCLFEVSFLRAILSFTRFTALLFYHRSKHSWGRVERKKIEVH